MTTSEYQQLVEFLGHQFSEVDRRFSEMDGRFSEVDRRFDDMGRQFTELRQEMLGHFDAIYGRSNDSSRSTRRSPRRCAGSKRDSSTRAAGARSSSATWPS